MKYIRTLFVAAVVYLALPSVGIKGQDSLMTNLKAESEQYFKAEDYFHALPFARKLLYMYPREPRYRYITGVCLVNLNQQLDSAILLLRDPETSDYYSLSWYYLGRAYHLNYQFDEAIKAYSKFLLIAKKSEIKKYPVGRLIEMAKNGNELTRSGSQIHVLESKKVSVNKIEPEYTINGLGKLIAKPSAFCTKYDEKKDYQPLIFLPAFTEVNEYIYAPGYAQNPKNGKDLFRIKNIRYETWGAPEPLGPEINTTYDEEYPYFDQATSTLYFSSKGHSSMGGYDIFKSIYDWNTKTWSKPVNLGFPINSPYDDYLFIPDEFNQKAMFVSNRSCVPGEVNIYKIKLEQDTGGVRYYSPDDIRKASFLFTKTANSASVDSAGLSPKFTVNSSTVFETKVMDNRPKVNQQKEYNQILTTALTLQLKADSCSRIARDKRILAKEATDQEDKKQLIAEIIQSDREAKSLQREADKNFALARDLQKNTEQTIDSSLVLTNEINGIKMYAYNSRPEKEANQEPSESNKNLLVNSTEIKKNEIKTEIFSILDKSPYSSDNPVPNLPVNLQGLVYHIQLGVFSKPRPFDAFGGITPLYIQEIKDKSMIKYYTGIFYKLESVTNSLEKVRSAGFPDAFIVAFYNGKPVTTEKAREIEFSGFKLK